MATIPGVFIIGGTNVQGGAIGNTPASEVTLLAAIAGKAGLEFYAPEIYKVVPHGTDGEPNADTISWWPWFDQNLGTLYTVDSATATTVTVTPDPGWTVNEWEDNTVTTSSTNLGFDNKQIAISSNTSDTLTVAAWTATPTNGAILWMNEGVFEDYAAITAYRTTTEQGAVSATRGGGAIAQGGNGIGWDAGLVAELWENVWDVSPYFVCAKFVSIDDTSDYASAGAVRTAAEDFFAKVDAAFAARYPSDTVEWRYIIHDRSFEDITAWIAEYPTVTKLLSYGADLTAEIAWLRSSSMVNNADARVLLIRPDSEILEAASVAASGASSWPWLTGRMQDVVDADEDALVRTVDFNGANLPTRSSAVNVVDPTANREYYSQHVYWREGAKLISKAIELWEAGAATAAAGVMPVYVLLGDSIEVGHVNSSYSSALDSDVYTATARDPRQRIWNRSTQAVEVYDAHNNSQTSGSTALTGSAGAEFSLTQRLMERHPDTGFVLIKRASASSGFATESSAYDANENGGVWLEGTSGEHWDALEEDIENCYQAINVQFGKQAELRAVYAGLGTNDAAVAGGGAAFEAALPAFVASIRNKFGTVVAGKATPFIWRVPHLGTASAIYDEMIEIRAALKAYAATDAQFLAQNVDDLERQSDNIHETAASNVTRGERIDDLIELIELPNCTVD